MNHTLFSSLEEAVTACFGPGVSIVRSASLSGGDINEARRLTLSTGEEVFVKSNTAANRAFFEAEEQGLRAIAAAGTIRTPAVLARGVDEGRNTSFLLLELLRSGRRVPDFWERFGHELAALHRADTSAFVPGFGFPSDNFIGATPQRNSPRPRWTDFFRDCRLAPQIALAERWFDHATLERFERLLSRLGDLLPEPEAPSLLHGDLWSGNFLVGPDGCAWLIDPAAYVGHAEADLAMTELFGGFAPAFYAAYREANPLEPGYRERRDLYNLYHLLNHLNLFGAGYLGAVRETLKRYG
jgi:fructosamine-3-kinase